MINEKKTFVKLQNIFFNSIFLIHYNFERLLYVYLNVFKRWKFAIMMYYVIDNSKNDIFARIAMQSIFFSTNYWMKSISTTDSRSWK